MNKVKKFNGQSFGEELFNSISHGVGALLAIAGLVVGIVLAAIRSDAMSIVGIILYGSSLVILYTSSCLYHAFPANRAKKVFQIFDHCSIFLLIWGTYIPVCFSLFRGFYGWLLFGLNGALAVLGIVFNSINLAKWHRYSLVLYVLMGWSVMLVADQLSKIGTKGLVLLIAGGVAYTGGIVFYAIHKKLFHFIWHLFVLLGSVLHYFFVIGYCI